ncbi:MAG: DUF5312 family protein [Spirochaetia bacterium]
MVEHSAGPGSSADGQESSGFQSIIDKIINIFFRSSDQEREKKRLLKQIGKNLKKSKYKFFKPRSGEALPGLAKFFFEVYRTIGPAQQILSHAEDSGVLKSVAIERELGQEQEKAKEAFDEDAIRKAAETMDPRTLVGKTRDQMVVFFSYFDSNRAKTINETYNLILRFLNFIHFDYYFLLKKFNSGIQEGSFEQVPKFEAINGEYVTDDLKDFIEIMNPMEPDADWDSVFETLNEYRGVEIVSRSSWKKLLSQIEGVKRSGIILNIVQYLDKDPFYKGEMNIPKERIVESYLNSLKSKTESTIQKILNEQRSRKVDKLATLIFGTSSVVRMKHYTDKFNLIFSKKSAGGFLYTAPLNYLKAFLLDYIKKDVRELHDLIIVRGKWANNITPQHISDAFHQLMQLSDQLIAFDEYLAEENEGGMKLKKALNTRIDPAKPGSLETVLKSVNDTAKGLINDSAQQLIILGKNIKNVLADAEKPRHELLMNWKELDGFIEDDLKTRVIDSYKKIYYFIQLLQIYVKKG